MKAPSATARTTVQRATAARSATKSTPTVANHVISPAQRQMSNAIDGSPRQVAQRQKVSALTGASREPIQCMLGWNSLKRAYKYMTGTAYKIGSVSPDLQPFLTQILTDPQAADLADTACRITGLPLNVVWDINVPQASYDFTTNTINITTRLDPTSANGGEDISASIRWELQNAEVNWTQVNQEHQLARNQGNAPMSRQDRIRNMLHLEKAEYIGLIRQFHQGIAANNPSSFADKFKGGRTAAWSSFTNYLNEQLQGGHYSNMFPDGAVQLAEVLPMLSDADGTTHNWTLESTPTPYVRPVELLEVVYS